MQIILVAIVAFTISQTIKISIRVFQAPKFSLTFLAWNMIWAGGFPSSHSAVIGATVYSVGLEDGFGTLFGFSVIVGLLFIYGLLESKKREVLTEEYLRLSADKGMKKIIEDKKLLDFSGHTFVEIIVGLTLGVLTALLIYSLGYDLT